MGTDECRIRRSSSTPGVHFQEMGIHEVLPRFWISGEGQSARFELFFIHLITPVLHATRQLGKGNPRPVHVRSHRGSLGIASDNPCLPEDWAWRRLPRANLIAEANERNERLRPATCSGRGVTAVICSLAGLGVVWAGHVSEPSGSLCVACIRRDWTRLFGCCIASRRIGNLRSQGSCCRRIRPTH
ncbi:hypothetical protein BGZ61DRAFT_23136 [Ilyonectria robusta]|uniref:uncharacterized protein n=1 Tax=Ilyonectria robusta TaxID=1079257 RepID=UPI001E8E59FA|nr:uncharacterized protein BGZ61DRAFT_23136 [Ilyonectria robusta]KAH8737814.1 hypothetical protein BGZ61DRAFT_23136 [Ilyonectria robusta]